MYNPSIPSEIDVKSINTDYWMDWDENDDKMELLGTASDNGIGESGKVRNEMIGGIVIRGIGIGWISTGAAQ